jgi:HCO3- transporter family.
MWIAVILIILVAVDASVLVCYITRFTEENFATLIAFIFIYKVSILGAALTAPITVGIVSKQR